MNQDDIVSNQGQNFRVVCEHYNIYGRKQMLKPGHLLTKIVLLSLTRDPEDVKL
jgi:hypothetical protein